MNGADSKLILITLLIKLGVAAAVASSLSRSTDFKRRLLALGRTRRQALGLVAWIAIPLMLGVWVRVRVPNFLAADLSFEATALVGLLLGPVYGALTGAIVSLPAAGHHEYLALPVHVGLGLLFGSYRRFATDEDVWSFSPLIDLSLYRWVRRTVTRPHFDRQISLLLLLMLGQMAAGLLADWRPHAFFALWSLHPLVELAICATTPMVVGLPLKIWNTVRIERKLEEQTRLLLEQNRLLLEARLDALQRQINPHFLFNTLNSVASLIRTEPELAREMIVKLGRLLRGLLRDREAFVPLEEELAFTDDYLDIEVIRFGAKLKVRKEIAEETRGCEVPTMLLQPLIENSIKHGLEPRISGGTVTLRSRFCEEGLILEVEDDGVGVDASRDRRAPVSGLVREGMGIGMRNVRERVQVLYGGAAQVEMESRPGRGTCVRLRLPMSVAEEVGRLRVGASGLE